MQKGNTERTYYLHMVLLFTHFMCSQLTESRLYVRFMENGLIVNLLQMFHLLDKETSHYAFFILGTFIGSDFKSCGYLERSIYVKGLIFSKLPLFYGNVLKFRISCEKPIFANFVFLFTQYLLSEDRRYFKSAVKSFLDDDTIYNITKLLVDVMSRDAKYFDGYIRSVVASFYQIYLCVEGTTYEERLCAVELRSLHRLAVECFSSICKNPSEQTLTFILSTLSKELKSVDPEDIQFYLDKKLYKKLTSTFASNFSRKEDVDYSILYNLIWCLNTLESVITNFEDKIKLKDVRPLISLLPDLVDSNKNNDSAAPPNFFMMRLVLASSVLRRKLNEENYRELKQRNILSLIVQNVRTFYDKDNIDIVLVSLPMITLSITEKHVACWLSLSEIDQLLPCIPVVLKLLSGQSDCTVSKMQTLANHDSILIQICTSLINSLLRIKENRKHTCINSKLDALRKCNFISSLGQALIGAENAQVTHEENETVTVANEEVPVAIGKVKVVNEIENKVIYMLYQSSKLFGSFDFMRGLCKMLPQLEKKQCKCINDSDNIDGFGAQCFWIMRKAIAYIIDDLHPDFVGKICLQVFNGWNIFKKSEGKMFFSSGLHTDEEESPNKSIYDESIVDVLRGTWWLIKKHPPLVNTYLPMFNPFFQVSSSDDDITDLTALTIIETIASYLENSQEQSTDFLIELTNFVKDLSYDCVGSEKEKEYREKLLPACKLLVTLNKNRAIVANLKLYIDANSGIIDDELPLD